MTILTCFKAYDIRGRLPNQLNENIAWRIGRAYAAYLQPRAVVVGFDVRLQSPALAAAVSRGLLDGGVDVVDIGLCGTEEVYFQTFHRQQKGLPVDGGIMVTASHNPMDYNGMKLVRAGSQPISGDSGLQAIRELAERNEYPVADRHGNIHTDTSKRAYIQHLLGYVDVTALLTPLKVVVNAGNGGAGLIIDELEKYLPFDFVKVHHDPDGSFPNGIPNPLLPENRAATAAAVQASGADFGIAWDGDFDRCFFFDENGRFIEGYYLVGLLGAQMLEKHPGAKIIHDPRLTWNTIDMIRAAEGEPIQSKTGHAFIKERMRLEDAAYGGEMSAHHYFRDFAYCDSGMIPWLLVAERLCRSGQRLSSLVDERMAAYPCSGEINFEVADSGAVIERILAHFAPLEPQIDRTDGISAEFPQWRFNLRASNTEPLLRLNVEARADAVLMQARTEEIAQLIAAVS
ncbi:phosphomannomutase [Plasticicumulans acidivorans]|uniref:phosphomannomutase n=1 Tax=Plasticicumulans acidivorans TaxID=886464 RepID=A0A317MSP6_9GAMM|nr:phosphomannomutase [Plasticicumulans acidivorans]PWV59583.1 phosphomannomutase [Plasticicumulans acidivorans]